MANTLAGTSSPYLQQHADNPVDWQPWSPEALARAKAEDKPLLISIGYASCHWCHVMAHESFEDEEIAALMNEHFVCIKVDREERPDVDAIYMDACQQLQGGGGWPLNAFALPDGKPFWAGAYFPPEPKFDLPSWRMVLDGIIEAWTDQRAEAEETGTQLTELLAAGAHLQPADALPGEAFLEEALATLQGRFDSLNGGFGDAPKFPPSTQLSFLTRLHELSMPRYTLTSMATGGIFDQLGGGFSRYTADAAWTVPHFEKMLYDNALLAQRYAEMTRESGDDGFGGIAQRTLDWVLTDLADADGGFASGLDADSGGVEGAYYVWTPAQLAEALDEADLPVALEWFGVTDQGTMEDGTSVLQMRGSLPPQEQADRIVLALLEARGRRERPGRDGKRIVSWNALTVESLAVAGLSLDRPDYIAAAERCAELILDRAADPRGPGRLLRLIPFGDSESEAAVIPPGVLADHADMLSALVRLYETTFDARWLTAAREIADAILRNFADHNGSGFFSTADDAEQLITRRKELDDTPTPSGQGTAALALTRLSALTGEASYRDAAEGVLKISTELAGQHPFGLAQILVALDQFLAEPMEIAIVGEGDAFDELVEAAREHAGPSAVIAAGPPAGADAAVPLLAGRDLVDGQPAAYVCRKFVCQAPVTSVDALIELVEA